MLLAALFLVASCKKLEERGALILEVRSFNGVEVPDGGPYPSNVTEGQEVIVEYYYESSVPLQEVAYGTDLEADQSEYLIQPAVEGTLSGTIKFKFVTSELLPGTPDITGPWKKLKMQLLNEEGVVAIRDITFRKVN